MRLFLDANVLFAAAYSPHGRSAQMIALAALRDHDLLTSPHALTEAQRNLRLKRPEALPRLEAAMTRVNVAPEATPDAVRVGLDHGLPLKDAPILGAAIQANVDLLVTGDGRHFGHLYENPVNDMKVVTPAAALTELLNREE